MWNDERGATPRNRIAARLVLALVFLPLLGGCIHRFYILEKDSVSPPPSGAVTVSRTLRAHLRDGGVAIFQPFAQVSQDGIRGTGMRFDFARRDSAHITMLA